MQNLGFGGHRIVGVFDTDSLTVVPEAVVVGHAAAIFSADWATDDPDPLPSLAEMQAFVEDGSVSDDQLSASTIPSGPGSAAVRGRSFGPHNGDGPVLRASTHGRERIGH